MVVAMSRDGLIGREGGLPWHLPRDLRHFRRLTWGKPVIMGRKTHRSLGRPLPGRTNIILTRQEPFHAEGCLVAHTRDQALQLAAATGASEAMIIGGRAVYQAFLPLCRTIHLTLVEGTFEGDTFFPAKVLESPDWQVVDQERWPSDDRNPFDAVYLLLKRRDQCRWEPRASSEITMRD
jgi:dihydrofolate reductase